MNKKIEFIATNEVIEALASLGRTEDVKFSPDNRRLAIAGFTNNMCLVIDIQLEVSSTCKKVILSDFIEIRSSCLNEPHGLSFIDQETLVVANRSGNVPVLKLPPSGMGVKQFNLSPLQTIRSSDLCPLESPGSVAASPLDNGLYEVLICNNYVNRLTRHVLDSNKQYQVISNEVLLQNRLDIPDGVALNQQQEWIAISNHNYQCVLLFKNSGKLNPYSEPSGILRNVCYPHGVRFTPDDNFVLVADAGGPFVQVYVRGRNSWHGMHYPTASVRVMDEETFSRGRYNPQEGGPKGIDIDSEMNVLVTTCEHQPLAFFNLPAVLNSSEPELSTSMME